MGGPRSNVSRDLRFLFFNLGAISLRAIARMYFFFFCKIEMIY